MHRLLLFEYQAKISPRSSFLVPKYSYQYLSINSHKKINNHTFRNKWKMEHQHVWLKPKQKPLQFKFLRWIKCSIKTSWLVDCDDSQLLKCKYGLQSCNKEQKSQRQIEHHHIYSKRWGNCEKKRKKYSWSLAFYKSQRWS